MLSLNKKNKIIILHAKNQFFGQTRKPWVSMDLQKINSYLRDDGFLVENYEYQEVVNNNIEIKDSIIFYSFSQRENVRSYIKDLIHHLSNFNNLLIPSYDLLLCHENKGYQELYKKRLGITSLGFNYYEDKEAIDFPNTKFPLVLKKVDGSNGKNVYLINNEQELKNKIEIFEHINKITKADLFRRKYLRTQKEYAQYPHYSNKKDYAEYKDYITKRDNFVLQEFVPKLEYDYRVLAVYDKFFVTKRMNKENDFRASGAKRYDFSFELDEKLLNFSKELFSKFDTPILSMDICKSEENFYLIEYQAIHFGINVVVKSEGYYQIKNDKWAFEKNKNVIEEEIAYGISSYVKKIYF